MQDRITNVVIPGFVMLGFLFVFFYYIVFLLNVGMGIDYFATYEPATEWMLNGEGDQLYDDSTIKDPSNSEMGFYNLPWLLYIFVPLQILSPEMGIVVWNVISVLFMVGGIELWRHNYPTPSIGVAFAMANVHTFDFLLRSQIDSFILLCAIISWWALLERKPIMFGIAFAFMITKPLNVVLLSLMFAYMVLNWSWRERLLVVLPSVLLALSAFPLFGWDWPYRYFTYGLEVDPPLGLEITLWKAANVLGIPSIWVFVPVSVAIGAWLLALFRYGASPWLFNISITTGLFITVFANGNHYIMLIPAMLFVTRYHLWVAAVAYLLTWTPLSRVFLGKDSSPMDIAYPAFLMLVLWYLWWQVRSQKTTEITTQA